ncbi:MAG: hypothetical protein M4D80_39810 [Myxococcota bacterium]|nr:hypothetical protein [Myxococcota bacterium]
MKTCLPLLFLLACGDRAATSPDATTPDAPSGVERPVRGTIEVLETRHLGDGGFRSSQVSARFFDRLPPRWHREAMRAGACVLRLYSSSFCSPACTSGLCADGTCERFPDLVSGGRLTVKGLAVGMQIDPTDGLYFPSSTPPPDLFGDSATVTASLAGAKLPAMMLSTRGVPALVAAIQNGMITVPYPAGQDFAVRWTPAAGGARVRLTLNANNEGHGLPYLGIIECDAPDSAGEITIPAALLDAFPETNPSPICAGTDCPPSLLRRYQRATHAIGDHDIELIVGSELQFRVEHDRP